MEATELLGAGSRFLLAQGVNLNLLLHLCVSGSFVSSAPALGG